MPVLMPGCGRRAPRGCKVVFPLVPILAFVILASAHAQTTGFAKNADRPSKGTVPVPAKPTPRGSAASSTGDALMELGNRLLELDKAQVDAGKRKQRAEITVAATASNGCAAALNVGGNVVSVTDPITSNGSAKGALDGARANLRSLEAQGLSASSSARRPVSWTGNPGAR